jgi:thiamine biosynthesis protein ThiS
MPSILLHAAPHPLPTPSTVAGLLASLNRDPKKVAVEVNEEVVPREQHATTELRDGDRVEIVTLVGGG